MLDLRGLYEDHRDDLLAYLARRTADAEVALDLLAETFAQAVASQKKFRADGDPVGWLYGIAKKQLALFYRRGRIEQKALKRLGIEREPPSPEVLAEIAHRAGLEQLRRELQAAMGRAVSEHAGRGAAAGCGRDVVRGSGRQARDQRRGGACTRVAGIGGARGRLGHWEPHMSELDRYLDDLGGKLARARHRRSRRPLVALPALAVGIVAATLVFGPGGQRHPVDAVAAARAALETNGQILHMKLRIELDPSVKVAPGARIAHYNEQWSQSDPKRWRFHETRTDGSWSEFAYVDGTATDYDSDTNRRRNITGYKDTDPQARALGLFGVNGNDDPDADLKAMLAAGKLKDAGLLEANGRTVRRLQRGDRFRGWIYDVDPDTFAPVGGSVTTRRPGGPEDTTRFFVEVYERIPLGTDVFTIKTKPLPTVTTLTKAQFLDQIKQQRRRTKVWSRCVKRNHGSHKGCGPSPYTTTP